jgi:hypothetical protein
MSVEGYPVATMADGAELAVHVHEIPGASADGPTVGICGSIHGDEIASSQIIMEVAAAIAGRVQRGKIVLLPVADPLGFAMRERETPHDSQNLNRVFPGNADGWLTEKLAAVITERFLNQIDVLIDLHSGGASQTVDYVFILNDEGLSRSFGSRILYKRREGFSGTYFSGTLYGLARDRDIRAVTVELGGGLVDQRPYVKRGVAGVLNMLRTLAVIDGSPTPPPVQVVVERIVMVRPSQGGWLISEAPELGAEVAGGAVLGRVVSPYTFEELEVIRNPVQKGIMILSHLTTDVVHPGAYGYMVGDLAPDVTVAEKKVCT